MESRGQGLLVVLALRGDDDVAVGTQSRRHLLQPIEKHLGVGEALCGGPRIAHADGEVHQLARARQGLGQRGLADDKELGPGQERLDVDLQGALALTGHVEIEHPFRGLIVGWRVRTNPQQSG